MADNTKKKLLDRAMAGEDVTGELGDPQVVTGPVAQASTHPDGEVMVGRSVRMRLDTMERVRVIAQRDGVAMSDLLRQWIDAGLTEAEEGLQPDPVVELRHIATAATRALRALEDRAAA